jgi:endonuclease/exonuclease/phosphatase family metal-dependent hydrolase
MRQWLWSWGCVLVTALVGCAVSEKIARREVPFQTEGDNIKVMTFNIRYGTAADGPNQVEQIHNALKGYALVTAGRDDGKMAGEHCSILYRTERFKLADSGTFWFSNSPWVSGSKHWGNQIPRICTWARLVERDTDRALFVYNLHLDHQSQTSRFKSAELLARVVSQREPKDPVIVMGDFNMGLDNPAMLYLRRLGYPNAPVELLDSWRLLYPDKPEIRTFHGFEGGTEGIKIDHILIERTTKVLDAQIDRWSDEQGRYPSDHYPVTAVLQLWN